MPSDGQGSRPGVLLEPCYVDLPHHMLFLLFCWFTLFSVTGSGKFGFVINTDLSITDTVYKISTLNSTPMTNVS